MWAGRHERLFTSAQNTSAVEVNTLRRSSRPQARTVLAESVAVVSTL